MMSKIKQVPSGLANLDWGSIIKGALFAACGAIGAYLIHTASGMDWGTWTPFVGAILAILAQTLHVTQTHLDPPKMTVYDHSSRKGK